MNSSGHWYRYRQSWSFILGRYLPRLMLCSLVWEIVQLPLYALWVEPDRGRIAFAVVHCTLGDALIGTLTLLMALALSRAGALGHWPNTAIRLWLVGITLAYTVASERYNLAQGHWAYADGMPIVPGLAVGLAPLLQWLVVPVTTWWWASTAQRDAA